MFKTTAIDTLKQDKKCQACWYIILSTMSGSTTNKQFGQIMSMIQQNPILAQVKPEALTKKKVQ